MDKMLYLAMNGAKHVDLQQATTANNLANVHTTGFKADLVAFRALPVVGDGAPTRVYQVDNTVGHNLSQGALQQTGNDFDFALSTPGFFAVQLPDGSEAYTRGGGFELDASGTMRTRSGLVINGQTGPLQIPEGSKVVVREDGTVFADPGSGGALQEVGTIKLVNPPAGSVYKGDDGLFRQNDGQDADADPAVHVRSGFLEASNVNAVDGLVEMINHSKQYELNVRMMQTADQDARQATEILTLNG
ncbi:flagellar basal body rod protein FlgF [Vogesella sp. LIG4]|uniref:flagellar basal body rod protein FlgF n=1 Tax=Vogesella sp. LIG4 TaxID=1192162 RepID=UPI00081F79B5|nr:flagellar basal body rod protein FlgF [Vogesella sp. LIG4]SCK30322.1 flagellar basal-body rod protein FlgF [Vogesella sp. LIG4]